MQNRIRIKYNDESAATPDLKSNYKRCTGAYSATDRGNSGPGFESVLSGSKDHYDRQD